jgi:predicted metalloendopeptidase
MTLPSALDYHSSATVDAYKFNIRSTLQVLATYRVDTFQGVDADQWANEITSLEMKLAVINESPDQLYASTVSKTLYSIHELDALIPSLDWAKYFGLATKNPDQVLYVRTPEYLKGLQDLLAVESSRTLHAYIVWHTLLSNSNEMPMEARNAIRAINRDLVYDEDEHCARKVNSVFGSLIGDYFPVVDQEGMQVMQQLFIDIKRTLARTLPKFGWIDRMTSGHAIRKVSRMTMYSRFIIALHSAASLAHC